MIDPEVLSFINHDFKQFGVEFDVVLPVFVAPKQQGKVAFIDACNTHVPLTLQVIVIRHLVGRFITPDIFHVLRCGFDFEQFVGGQLTVFESYVAANGWIDDSAVNVG